MKFNDEQRILSELRVSIQWIAECLLKEKTFLHQVVASTLRCGRDVVQIDEKCPIKMTETLQKIEELKPKIESFSSIKEQKDKQLRVLTRNNITKRSFYTRGNTPKRVYTFDRAIVPNNSLKYIKLCKVLIFQILQSYHWRSIVKKDTATRCQKLFNSSILRVCFLSILLSSLSDKYVDISSVYKATKFFSSSKRRYVFRKLKERTCFHIDAARLAAHNFDRIRGYSTLALLSNNWKAGVLKRMIKSYLSKFMRAKALFRVWMAWTTAVVRQRRDANVGSEGDSVSALKSRWSSISYTIDNYLCCISAEFLDYIRCRIYLFPHSWWRNTTVKSDFLTLLDAFSKSSLFEILNTLAEHSSKLEISFQWTPNYLCSFGMPQNGGVQQKEISSSYHELEGQVQIIQNPSHGSELRPIEILKLTEHLIETKVPSKPVDTAVDEVLINRDNVNVSVQGEKEISHSAVGHRNDRRGSIAESYNADHNTAKSITWDEAKIESVRNSVQEGDSEVVQTSTPCKEVRTQTETHSTTSSVQTIDECTVKSADQFRFLHSFETNHSAVVVKDSSIQTEPLDEHIETILVDKAESVVADLPVPVQSNQFHRVPKADGFVRYCSLDDRVPYKAVQQTMPAKSTHSRTVTTQTRNMNREIPTQTESIVATAMQTVCEDQAAPKQPLHNQLVRRAEVVGYMKSENVNSSGVEFKGDFRSDGGKSSTSSITKESPSLAEIAQTNQSDNMQRIAEDVKKSAQSIADALEKIETLSHRNCSDGNGNLFTAENGLESKDINLLFSSSSFSSPSSASSSSSSSSSSSPFAPLVSGHFLSVHGSRGMVNNTDLYSMSAKTKSSAMAKDSFVTSLPASTPSSKSYVTKKSKMLKQKEKLIPASKVRYKMIERHSHTNVALQERKKFNQSHLPSVRANPRVSFPSLSNKSDGSSEDDLSISSKSSEDSEMFAGQFSEARNYFYPQSDDELSSDSFPSIPQEVARSVQTMTFRRMISSCRGFIRFLKRLARFRQYKNLLESRRARIVFIHWSENYCKITRKLKRSDDICALNMMQRHFSAWSSSRSSYRFGNKILQVCRDSRRAVVRAAFSSWMKEISQRRHLATIVTQLEQCRRGRILREWRKAVRNDIRMRQSEMAVRSNRVRPFFNCWRKKLGQKALLRRVFEYRDMAISFQRYNLPSEFQSLLSVVTAWAEYTRRQRMIRWSLAAEKKALFFRGVTLMARYFMQWVDFHERFRGQEIQRRRQVKMLSRQCFFSWKSFTKEIQHRLTLKILTKEFRIKCAVVDTWKDAVRVSLEERPKSFRRRRLMETVFDAWKVLKPLRLLLSPIRQSRSTLRQRERAAFSCWRSLYVRRERYRIGLSKLTKVYYSMKIRRCFLELWPGSRSIRLASEYWGHTRKKGRRRIAIVGRSEPMNIDIRNPGFPPEITGSDVQSFIVPRRESLFERAVRLGYVHPNSMEQKEQGDDDEIAEKLRLQMVTVFLEWYRLAGGLRFQRCCARAVLEKANRKRLVVSLRRWMYQTPLTKHRIVVWIEKPPRSNTEYWLGCRR